MKVITNRGQSPLNLSRKAPRKGRCFQDFTELRVTIANAPLSCGCYSWSKNDELLYVGKAKNLRNRLKSYLNEKLRKTQAMISEANRLDWIITENEEEAYLLEANLVKSHQPKYNARLKDDKKYPYLKLTIHDTYPQLVITRQKKADSQLYFGPYTNVRATRNILAFVDKSFKLRKIRQKLPLKNKKAPCLNYHIQRCLAPCQGNVDVQKYSQIVHQVTLFLQGRHDVLMSELEKKMITYSDKQSYEQAAQIRNILRSISKFQQRRNVLHQEADADLIALARNDGDTAQIVIFQLRNGNILSKLAFLIIGVQKYSDGEIIRSFLRDHYLENLPPARILSPIKVEDKKLLEQTFHKKWQQKSRILSKIKQIGVYRLAQKNAALLLNEHLLAVQYRKEREIALQEIKQLFQLPATPAIMECFDISHTAGQATSASSVQFLDGVPNSSSYRRYKIRSVSAHKIDDFQAIFEVLFRRLRRLQHENLVQPDLLIIDGGQGQLNAAKKAARQNNLYSMPIIALAKANEEIYFENKLLRLKKNEPALLLLRHIRDEAHRFALQYHRLRRKKEALPSIKEQINRPIEVSANRIESK